MTKKWVLATAGLGAPKFEEASNRLISQAKLLYPFAKIIQCTNSNLSEHAPKTLEKYEKYLKSNVHGFGYFIWKSELVNNALNNPDVNGVVWADAGCEFNYTKKAKIIFKFWLFKASTKGYLIFSLNTPETKFSKKIVYKNLFKSMDTNPKIQFQATFFILAGKKGREIAQNWFEATSFGIEYSDDSISENESPDFISHRWDQSIFSMTIKSFGIKRGNLRLISSGSAQGFKKRLYSFIPVFMSRNRAGKSSIFN